MKISVVIMAGGVGARFWPQSRERRPKQLLEVVTKGRSLVQATVERIQHFANLEDVFIVTNEAQREELERQVSNVPTANILSEPFGRNTATCIALGAKVLKERYDDDTVMLVLPADHVIRNGDEFTRLMQLGAKLAHDTRGLVTVGVHPTRAETGYGYIQLDDEHVPSLENFKTMTEFELRDVFFVKRFAEKPDADTAQRFVESGDFLWNSGIFMWRLDAIQSALEEFTPEITEQLNRLPLTTEKSFESQLKEAYSRVRGVSIDYGVMEHAKNVYVVRAGALGWSDVGSWDEVYRLSERNFENNVLEGDRVIAKATKGCLVISPGDQLMALYGVENLIVINTGDAILVTDRNSAQGVKELVDYLKRNQMTEYL